MTKLDRLAIDICRAYYYHKTSGATCTRHRDNIKRESLMRQDILQSDNFKHFRRTAELVDELGVNPLEWVTAQFEIFRKSSKHKKFKTVLPNMLYSDRAQERFQEWCEKNGKAAYILRDGDKCKSLALMSEEERLRRIIEKRQKVFDLPKESVLTTFPTDFPQWFHEQNNTWTKVKSFFRK